MGGQEMLAVQEAISRQWRVKKKLASDMSNMKMKNHSQLSVTKIQTLENPTTKSHLSELKSSIERMSHFSCHQHHKQRTLLHRMTLLAAAFWSRTRSNAAHFSRRAV